MSGMAFQQKLIEWFDKNQRPLPWRRHYRPYAVWVSEIMLQQTQMDTVLPYFERWMKAFPDIRRLAKADEKKVLKLWEGLGYYSRARNLHAGAKLIVEKYGGEFPEDFESILELKGVGRYTAGAIASIAFNRKRPIVDGNIYRVLARLYAIAKPVDVPKNQGEFWRLQEKLIPPGQARNFNQALMEFGALVCTPQNPACPVCPLQGHCRAFKEGDAERYPVRSGRRKTVKVEAAALALKKDGKYLLRLRPVGSIMGGLWEFPEWKLGRDKTIRLDEKLNRLKRLAKKEFGTNSLSVEHAGRIKRNYTHHLETMDVFSAEVVHSVKPKTDWNHVWASPKEFVRYPFSSAHAKIARLLK